MNAVVVATKAKRPFDVARIRADFPILARTVYDKPLVFLDSAASAQKPRAVIDVLSRTYENEYANIHRGVYYLSQKTTDAFEAARETARRLLNAREAKEIVFVRGGTEAINLVAQSWGFANLKAGDEVVLTELEHHSNIVPWQLLRDRTGIVIRAIPVDETGTLDMDAYAKLLNPRTKLVAVTHCSNVTGTVPPIKEIARMAHAQGALVLVDGCQSAPRLAIDVQDLDCDFYVVTGHKLYGPSGTGFLYGKAELLDAMPPYQGGGGMIRRVSFERTEYAEVPHRFEAGTPNIAGTIGLAAAMDYVMDLGLDAIERHEAKVLDYAHKRLSEINSVRIVGTAKDKASILSFNIGEVHPHDVGTILDREGVAVRVGHHCAQPLMDKLGLVATVRASFGVYNTMEDVDALCAAVQKVQRFFG
ncbi:MAG: cysteine desulfurase [Alphaproteobacteria bacterium]|nr:cysteine desulfurase [Alphaproteobacteria bacterium]